MPSHDGGTSAFVLADSAFALVDTIREFCGPD
jgi:hypothetical protein